MLKIGILQLGYETNTFLAGQAKLKDLGSGDWLPGKELVSMFEGKHAGISGAIKAIREAGAEPVGIDSMSRGGAFNAGATLSRNCVEQAMDHICQCVSGLRLDGLVLAGHGAGCAEGYADADGYFLTRLRKTLGNIPITCSLDLHANVTDTMVSLTNGLFGIKEYPHTDYYEASYFAASTLIKTLQGTCKPQTALVRLPMLVATAAGCTLGGFAGEIRDQVKAFAKEKGLLDATFFHGFDGCDSEYTCCSVVAVADGFDSLPYARELADKIYAQRHKFAATVYPADVAIEKALQLRKDGYCVINEGSDNPGNGCPGDGTHLLRALLKKDLPGTIMGPVFDPEAAAICHSHTPGDSFMLTFGGKTDPIFGAPITAKVELLSLCDGTFECATPVHKGATMCHGPSARIRISNVEVILVSVRFQTYDDRPFTMLGAVMTDYRLVGLKSMAHFRAYFKETADAIVTADTPSTIYSDIRTCPYKYLKRPIFPLEEI